MSGTLPDNGRRLIIQLKECGQRLTQLVHDDPSSTANEKNADAQRFCEAVEVIFLHGIKIKEYNGAIPLWAFLERLENLQPPCIPLRNTIGAVASMPTFRNPIAKARAWIRQVLNAGHLDESAMFMMAQSQLLRMYYNPGAILLNAEEGMGLVSAPCIANVGILYDIIYFLIAGGCVAGCKGIEVQLQLGVRRGSADRSCLDAASHSTSSATVPHRSHQAKRTPGAELASG